MSYKGYPQGNDPYIKGRPADYPSIKTTYDRSNITDFNAIILSGDVNKLDIFLSNNNKQIVNILDEKTNENALHKIIETSLPILDKLNVIKYLITKKIFINVQNKIGDTPLAIAIKNGEKDIVLELINNGADANIANKLGVSPFHYLAKGTITDCDPTKVEDFIDEPKPKHDKKAISKIAGEVKQF